MTPLERACREMRREDGIPETEWRIFENTLVAAGRVLGFAIDDLGRAIRQAWSWWPW